MKYTEEMEGLVLNILDQFFTIHFHKDLERRFERLGQADPLRGVIWLDADAHERNSLSTLLHEVVELIVTGNAIKMDHQDIVILENGLFMFCMRNIKVLEILLAEAKAKTGSRGMGPEALASMEPVPPEEVEKVLEELPPGEVGVAT
jgi:hypothetical protein